VTRTFSGCSLGTAILFIIFLAASGPHRVHHLFEQLPFSQAEQGHSHYTDISDEGGHGHDSHERTPDKKNDCVVQAVTKNAPLSAIQLLQLSFIEFAVDWQFARAIACLSCFNAAPLSQRAPPKA
jgi:hypothetical protein